MDPLSDVLRVIRLAGGVFLEAEFTAPWCISGKVSPDNCRAFQVVPRHVIASHLVTEGRMQLQVQGCEPVEVRAGELILLPHNDAHVFGSDTSLPFTPAHDLIQSPTGGGLMRVRAGGGGAATQILCGFLGSDIAFTPLLSALPPVMKLDMRGSASGAWIESSFRFAVSEIASGRMGSATVIAKLSELLFIEAIGQYLAGLPSERLDWLAGLRDPQIGRALALLHEKPMQAWTAEELAVQVGMSRSAFAERFTELVGDSPMHYLAMWRMHVAAQQLRDGPDNVAQVAFAVGYDSEAAFSRAFKRQFGESPGAWRRQ
jgi:AraC-like DNA-binding protein